MKPSRTLVLVSTVAALWTLIVAGASTTEPEPGMTRLTTGPGSRCWTGCNSSGIMVGPGLSIYHPPIGDAFRWVWGAAVSVYDSLGKRVGCERIHDINDDNRCIGFIRNGNNWHQVTFTLTWNNEIKSFTGADPVIDEEPHPRYLVGGSFFGVRDGLEYDADLMGIREDGSVYRRELQWQDGTAKVSEMSNGSTLWVGLSEDQYASVYNLWDVPDYELGVRITGIEHGPEPGQITMHFTPAPAYPIYDIAYFRLTPSQPWSKTTPLISLDSASGVGIADLNKFRWPTGYFRIRRQSMFWHPVED